MPPHVYTVRGVLPRQSVHVKRSNKRFSRKFKVCAEGCKHRAKQRFSLTGLLRLLNLPSTSGLNKHESDQTSCRSSPSVLIYNSLWSLGFPGSQVPSSSPCREHSLSHTQSAPPKKVLHSLGPRATATFVTEVSGRPLPGGPAVRLTHVIGRDKPSVNVGLILFGTLLV